MMEMLKSFKNIIADAVPKPPRSSKSEKISPKQETSNAFHEPEEVFVEDYVETEDFIEAEEKTNPPKNAKKKRKKNENGKEKKSKSNNTFSSEQRENGSVTINTQATGNVVTVVNGSGIQIGPTIFIGSTSVKHPKSNVSEDPEQHIKKCNLVTQLMEAEIKPEHEYIDYVSKNLGKNWYNIFLKLGFTIGAIETMEVNCKTYGVEEARYKLLLRWIDKDEKNTLGRLATLLWNEGERGIVKDLALRYDGER